MKLWLNTCRTLSPQATTLVQKRFSPGIFTRIQIRSFWNLAQLASGRLPAYLRAYHQKQLKLRSHIIIHVKSTTHQVCPKKWYLPIPFLHFSYFHHPQYHLPDIGYTCLGGPHLVEDSQLLQGLSIQDAATDTELGGNGRTHQLTQALLGGCWESLALESVDEDHLGN